MTTAEQAKQKAKARLEDFTGQVARARAEVEEAREAVAEGEATQADVNGCLKALAKAEDRMAQAQADLRVATRRQEQEAAHIAAETERISRALRDIALARRDAELARWRAFLEATLDQATEFDARLRGLRDQLHELDAGQFPSRWHSWPLLATFANDQLKHCPARKEV